MSLLKYSRYLVREGIYIAAYKSTPFSIFCPFHFYEGIYKYKEKNMDEKLNQENLFFRVLTKTEYISRYDSCCRKILADKPLLAYILKFCVPEYKDYSIKDIAQNFIEGKVEVENKTVFEEDGIQEVMPRIYGLVTVHNTIQEGTVYFDIIFESLLPKTNCLSKIFINFINIETQNKVDKDYSLVTRGLFYAARMLSAQYGVEFDHKNYAQLKKVYSIWICPNPPLSQSSSLSKFKIKKKDIIGQLPIENYLYDKLEVIVINLNVRDKKNSQSIIRMLEVVFSQTYSGMEKAKILEQEFDIKVSEQAGKEMDKMGGFGEALVMQTAIKVREEITEEIREQVAQEVREQVIQEARKNNFEQIKKLLDNGLITLEAALQLDLSGEQKEYLKKHY